MQRVSDEANLDGMKLNIDEITNKIGEEARGPFQNSFMQESECMNILIKVIVKSLGDIDLAFKGELTTSPQMETIMDCIGLNKVPPIWTKYGFVSVRALGSWLDNVKHRIE